jgi:hypothetical protein
LQRALNFPFFYLICQPGVNTNNGMEGLNSLRWARRDEDGGRLKQGEDEGEGEEAKGGEESEGRGGRRVEAGY